MVVEEKTQFRLVGKRMRRADSPERLTGNLRYTGDLVLPGLLHGRLVRSPYASARIVSIDKTEALATPGVVAVLAAEDLPVPNLRAAIESRSIMLAYERTTYGVRYLYAVRNANRCPVYAIAVWYRRGC